MIVKHKLNGTATKKNEVIGIFRRGGFSSTIGFKTFKRRIKIRFDNGQSIFLIAIIFIYKFFKHFKKFLKNYILYEKLFLLVSILTHVGTVKSTINSVIALKIFSL